MVWNLFIWGRTLAQTRFMPQLGSATGSPARRAGEPVGEAIVRRSRSVESTSVAAPEAPAVAAPETAVAAPEAAPAVTASAKAGHVKVGPSSTEGFGWTDHLVLTWAKVRPAGFLGSRRRFGTRSIIVRRSVESTSVEPAMFNP
jgi:hypothetical protein